MKKVKIQRVSLLIKLIFLLLVLSTLIVSGQKTLNEFSIHGGGGLAVFCFQPSIKNASSMGYGGDAGVGFTGFFNQNWGVHIGAGLGIFNIKNKVDNFRFITPEQRDCEGYLFDLHTTMNKYQETHQSNFLTVPIMLQFQTKTNQSFYWNKDEKVCYYAMAGIKALIPFNYDYTSKIASLNNMAYYPEFDNWINSLPILGLGTFDGNSTTGKLKFDALIMFAFETGTKWYIGRSVFLYTGVYFDCGLHDPTMKNRVPYRNYIHPEQLQEITLLEFTKTMNLMTAGIKLRLAFFRTQKEPCVHEWWKGVKVYKTNKKLLR